MGGIVQTLVLVADASVFLISEVINGLTYLIVRNYEMISFLLRLLLHCFYGVWYVAEGLRLALVDFVEQYGDLCLAILKIVIIILDHVIQLLLILIHVIFQSLSLLITCVKSITLDWPYAVGNAVVFTLGIVQSLPGAFLDTIVDGFSLLGTLVVHGIRGLFLGLGGAIWSAINALYNALGRKAIDNEVLRDPVRTVTTLSLEAFVGAAICVLSYLVYVDRATYLLFLHRTANAIIRFFSTLWRNIQRVSFVLTSAIRRSTFRSRPIDQIRVNPSTNRIRAPAAPLHRMPLNQRSVDPGADAGASGQTSRRNASSPRASVADLERFICVVCQDSEKSVMVENCRHVCMCRPCAELVFRRQRRCPICRSFILGVTDVYL